MVVFALSKVAFFLVWFCLETSAFVQSGAIAENTAQKAYLSQRPKLDHKLAYIHSTLQIRGGGASSSASLTSLKMFRLAARAGLQSASIMTLADVATQLLVEKRSLLVPGGKADDDNAVSAAPRYDPVRTLRWTTVGLALHGPYFFLSFGKLDKMFGAATNLWIVAKKTTFAQFVVFPPYLCALFTYLGIMEGNGDVLGKVKDRVPKAFMSGCVFWPIANILNFSFVPASRRVPYLAAVGGLWNGYLSWLNAKKNS